MGIVYLTKERMKIEERIRKHELIAHETKRENLLKFLLLLAVLVVYFIFIQEKYGTEYGIAITMLTWSFFVLCTPIADAGFLLDFPIRIFTKIKMIYTEVLVWVIAILINVYITLANPGLYGKTFLLSLFHRIILNPYPFWGIILLSAAGTFISIHLGDELMDVASYSERKKYSRHKIKYEIVIFAFLILMIIVLYDFLLKELGIELPF